MYGKRSRASAMLLALSVPPGNERGPLYMEQALAALHQANPGQLPLSLELARPGPSVILFCRCPDELRGLIESQLYAQYPDCCLERVSDGALDPPAGSVTWTAELHLHPDVFPIKRYAQFEDALNRTTADPLTALLTTLARQRSGQLRAQIEIVATPARAALRRRAQACLHHLSTPFFRAHHRLAHFYVSL